MIRSYQSPYKNKHSAAPDHNADSAVPARFYVFATRLIIFTERVFRALTPFLAWLLIFSSFSLVAADKISPALLSFASVFFYITGFFLVIAGVRKISFPATQEAERRLEQENHLFHRPFALLRDKPANGGDLQKDRLWEREVSIAHEKMRFLTLPLPVAGWVNTDRFALRYLLLLTLVCSVFIAGESWNKRLSAGLLPDLSASLFPHEEITLWVSPPDYTALPRQVYISDSQKGQRDKAEGPVKIPAGSEITVQAPVLFGEPTLVLNNQPVNMRKTGDKEFVYTGKFERGNKIAVRQFFITRAKWPVTILADTPPTLMRNSDQEIGLRDSQIFRVPLTVEDDYGISQMTMTLTPGSLLIHPPVGRQVTVKRILSTGPGSTEISPSFDLTSHPWAGLPVKLVFRVGDEIHQSSNTLEIDYTIPERPFSHPIAQELVADRKKLAWLPVHAAPEVIENLETILFFPEEIEHDNAVYLGLQAAALRLKEIYDTYYDKTASNGIPSKDAQGKSAENNSQTSSIPSWPDWKLDLHREVGEILDLLWALALKLEDGNLSLAMRALENAYNELAHALDLTSPTLDPSPLPEEQQGSPPDSSTSSPDFLPHDPGGESDGTAAPDSQEELYERTDTLRLALKDYIRELGRELRKGTADRRTATRISPDMLDSTLSPDALDGFMDRLEGAIRTENKEMSREILSQLRDLMDMLSPSLADSESKDIDTMAARVNELQELIANLRDLKYQSEKLAGNEESLLPLPWREGEFVPGQERARTPYHSKNFPSDFAKLFNSPPFNQPPGNGLRPAVPSIPGPLPVPQPYINRPLSPGGDDAHKEPGHRQARREEGAASPPPNHESPKQASPPLSSTPLQFTYKGKSEEQKAMRYVLGQLMKEAGEFFGVVPEKMGEAELLMRDSERQLSGGRARPSVPLQEEAIQKLLESQEELAEKLEEMIQNQGEQTGGQMGDIDPLGRQVPGGGQGEREEGWMGSFVEIPDESQRRYIQDILKKLQDKAGELNRPQAERDYIQRLLERY